jgi:hypothetical protein
MIIIIILCMSKQTENYTNSKCDGIVSYDKKCGQNFGYANPKCKRVPSYTQRCRDSYEYSDVTDSFDCYNKCMKDADCRYVGIGFDCYNNCFNNFAPRDDLPLVPTPPKLLEKF